MANTRRSSRVRGKSDRIDALAVARAALAEGIGTLPTAELAGPELDIRCSSTIASGWSARASGSTTRCSGTCTISGPSWCCRAARCSTASGACESRGDWRAPSRRCASGSPRDELRRLRELTQAINALETEIAELVAHIPPQLLAEPGFGPLTAAKLIGEIAGAARFSSDAKLARAAGLAPIPVSSGRTDRHRLDRGGNRQINAVIHRVAVTRARCHPETIEFLARKKTEGKAQGEAVRPLKRHPARRIWQLLRAPPPGFRNTAPPINFLTKEASATVMPVSCWLLLLAQRARPARGGPAPARRRKHSEDVYGCVSVPSTYGGMQSFDDPVALR
jgi:hypothetical protein